jgi:predicted transcriptional regulator
MKTSKVIMNMDTTLKKDAMKKAHKEGMNLSVVLNFATRAYVEDRLKISASDLAFEQGMADIRAGRTRPAEEVFKRLGIS